MAKSVAFPLLLTKHQGHRLLKGTTHEISVEISGDTDSLTLQMLYDTVQPIFLKERDALASVIDNFLRDMEKTTKSSKKQKYLEKFSKNSSKRIAKMDAAVTSCVNDFIAENQSADEAEETGLLISTWKFVVKNTWAAKNSLVNK